MQRIALVLGVMAVAAVPAAAAKQRPRPDLVVPVLHALPTAISDNGVLRIHTWVRNAGKRTARASTLRIELTPSGEPGPPHVLVATRRVGAIRPKHAIQIGGPFRIPPNVAPGVHHLLVCADARRVVHERDEDNNCDTHVVTITSGTGGPAVLAGFGTSITRAIELAAQRGLHEVDVVPGFYPESVVLTDGISIYGGGVTLGGTRAFDSGGGALAGAGLVAEDLMLPTRVEGVTLLTPDVSTFKGRDAIGILAARDAPGSLVLSHVTVGGGKAGPGASGLPGVDGVPGGDGSHGDDAVAISVPCDDVSRGQGGAGGVPAVGAASQSAGAGGGAGGAADTDCGTANTAPTPGFEGGPNGVTGGFGGSACSAPGDGRGGGLGRDGAAPAVAAAGGSVVGNLWITADGPDGGAGADGGGGAGGGGYGGCDGMPSYAGAGGGGGGAGGTGGHGGHGGQGGGAALGLLVIGGAVRVEASAIGGGIGGAGGNGGARGFGGAGGLPGAPGATPFSLPIKGFGGAGGSGGSGSGGGGGAGGASAGALVAGGGTLDSDAATTFTPGTAGAGGAGSVAGAAGAADALLRP